MSTTRRVDARDHHPRTGRARHLASPWWALCTVLLWSTTLTACDSEGSGPDDDAADDGGSDDGSDDAEDPFDGGGGDDGSKGNPPDGSFGDSVAPILAASCSCHIGGAGGLSFDGDAYGALVGVPAVGADMSYVEPGDVDNSYLVHKLRGTQASVGGGGGTMPPVGSLDDADIETIEAWIAAGAPE